MDAELVVIGGLDGDEEAAVFKPRTAACFESVVEEVAQYDTEVVVVHGDTVAVHV